MSLNPKRTLQVKTALNVLPSELLETTSLIEGEHGETLACDEAEAWKHALQYRISKYLHHPLVLETHHGQGVGTNIYSYNQCDFVSCTNFQEEIPKLEQGKYFDLIDIDPFGHPYEALEYTLPLLKDDGVLMVTSGEMMHVTRKMKKSQYLKTDYYGKNSHHWVLEQYLPYLEELTNRKVQYFYAYPYTIRVILSNKNLPNDLFKDCPRWMWWLSKYANNTQTTLQ